MIRFETSKAKDEAPLVAAGALTASVTSTLTSITPEASLEIWPPQVPVGKLSRHASILLRYGEDLNKVTVIYAWSEITCYNGLVWWWWWWWWWSNLILKSFREAKPCSALIVSAARSIGAAGRKFTVSWSFGTVDVATTALEVASVDGWCWCTTLRKNNVFAFCWWLLGRSGLEGNQASYGLY